MPIDKFIQDTDFTVEGFDPEKFKQDALAEFAKDKGVWQSAVETRDEKIKGFDTEIRDLKSTNYDLLNQIPRDSDNTDTSRNKPEEKDPTDVSIDDLFGSDE